MLKQQTPLIHFQHDDNGATLRASEVKPKLDRFITSKFKNNNRKIPDKWYINPEEKENKPALKYKMRFIAIKSEAKDIPYKIFFANMGKGEKDHFRMIVGDCKMTLICFIPELMSALCDALPSFFISHSFGFMQGKGFGGYLLDKTSTDCASVCQSIKAVYGSQHVYCIRTSQPIFVNKQENNSYGKSKVVTPPNIFDNIIKPFHSLMKSGININGYERSFIFQYFQQKSSITYGNDKAFVKSRGIAPVVYKTTNRNRNQSKKPPKDEYKYIRALLGITDNIEYIQSLDMNDKPKGGKTKIAIKSADIGRFASPIRYRIIDHTVYIFAVPIDERIYGAKFEFSSSVRKGSINVPDKEDFDIEDFLHQFIHHMNNNNNARKLARYITSEIFEEVK